MEPLSEMLALFRPRAHRLHALDAAGDWAIRFSAYAGVKFDAMAKGDCWLFCEGLAEPCHLMEGDCFLLTGGHSFVLASDPALVPVASQDALRFDAHGVARCNGGGGQFLSGAHFTLDEGYLDALFSHLPAVIVVRAERDEASVFRWAMQLFMREFREGQPGSLLTAEHLAHIMLIQALRLYLAAPQASLSGWPGALAHPRLSAAIQAIHADVARRWTLTEMAAIAGMSRSSFAARFKQIVGRSPLDYLIQWRMQIARVRLANKHSHIATIAHEVGYESEAAFSTAFKRVHGYPPRAQRRERMSGAG